MDSGGGGGQQAATTSVTRNEPPAYIQPHAEQLMTRGGELSKTPYEGYTGTKIADLTPEHQAALSMTANRAIQGSPDINAARNNLTQTMSGQFMLPGANPFLDASMMQGAGRMADAYATGTGAQMGAMGRNSGSFGNSGVQEMQSLNNRAFGDSLAKYLNEGYGGNYQKERQNQMAGMLFAPQLAQTDYQDANALLGVGDIRRGFEQDKINQNQADWYAQKNDPYAKLNVLGSSIGQAMGAGGGTSSMSGTQPNPYRSNNTANMLGLGMSGLGLAAQLGWISDRRLKENIKPVGKLDNGLTVYSYNYKWDKTPTIGVMADEVEKVNPAAVLEHASGFKMVNYGAL